MTPAQERWAGRRLLALLLLAAVVVGGWSARAADSPPPSAIGIIDMQRILRESSAVKALTESIEAQRAAYQEELRAKEQQLRQTDQELARQRSVLSPESFAEKRNELQRQVLDAQREIEQRKRNLDEQFGAGMQQVERVLIEVAQEIARERELDLVLAKATVVLVRTDLEITDEALERLNARLPRVEIPALQN